MMRGTTKLVEMPRSARASAGGARGSASPLAPELHDNQPRLVAFEIARLVTATTDNLCLIRGLSSRGAIIQTSTALARGDRVTIEMRSGEQIGGVISATFPVGSSVWFDKPAEVESLLGGGHATGARGRPRLPRFARNAPVTIDAGERRLEGSIRNISTAGACIELARPEDMPALNDIAISLDGLGTLAATVKWRKTARIGVKFEQQPIFGELEAWLSATPAPPEPPAVDANPGIATKEIDPMTQSGQAARRNKEPAMSEAALMGGAERPRERRRHKRFTTVFRLAKMVGEREELCLIRNVSASGLKAEVFSAKSVGERLAIDFGDHNPQSARVAWVTDGYVGITFDDHIDVAHTLSSGPTRDDRRARRLRFLVRLAGYVMAEQGRADCMLVDISQGGARIRTDAVLERGQHIRVAVRGHGTLAGRVLWMKGGDVGIGFFAKLAYRELAEWINHGDNVPG